MSDRVVPGPITGCDGIREAVCIHTKKIYDSCRDKDCLEDLRVYPTRAAQALLDRATSVRSGRAELLHTSIDVAPATYNRGFYSVDIRYYYRVTAEAFTGGGRPCEVSGLAVFDKRVLLFGSEGSAKTFSSRDPIQESCCCGRGNPPEAVVEAVDPIVLNLRLADLCGGCDPCMPCPPPCPPNPCAPPPCPPPCPPCPPPCGCGPENELTELPACISACFDGELVFDNNCRRLYVTLGQFSIVRLERDTHLLIPMYDYCMPTRECSAGDCERDDDPCEIFRQIRFPVGEFFPPSTLQDGARLSNGGHMSGMEDPDKGCGYC